MVTHGIELAITSGGPNPRIPVNKMVPLPSYKGRGSPQGVVPANPGQRYIDLDTSEEWQKISGEGTKTGWVKESIAEEFEDEFNSTFPDAFDARFASAFTPAFSTAFPTALTAGTIISTGSSTTRTLANRFTDLLNILDFGGSGNGTTSQNSVFTAWMAAGDHLYLPSGTYRITSNLTIPGTKRIRFGPAAIIAPDSGVTVTIPLLSSIDAGMQQIFGTAGDIRFGESPYGKYRGEFVPVTWFGADGEYNAGLGTDSTTAFVKCLAAASTLSAGAPCDVFVPAGSYIVKSTLSIPPKMRLFGARESSYIYFDPTTNSDWLMELAAGDSFTIENLRLIRSGNNIRSGTSGILASGASRGEMFVKGCDISDFNGTALQVTGGALRLYVSDTRFQFNTNGQKARGGFGVTPAYAIQLEDMSTGSITDCKFFHNDVSEKITSSSGLQTQQIRHERNTYEGEGCEWTETNYGVLKPIQIEDSRLITFDDCYFEYCQSAVHGFLVWWPTLTVTLSQSGTTVTASGAFFSSDMVGGRLFFAAIPNASDVTIDTFIDSTHVTVSASQTAVGGYGGAVYYAVTATQAGSTAITTDKPFFTSAMIGWQLRYGDRTGGIISAVTNSKSATLDTSLTKSTVDFAVFPITSGSVWIDDSYLVKFNGCEFAPDFSDNVVAGNIVSVNSPTTGVVLSQCQLYNPWGSFVYSAGGSGSGVVRLLDCRYEFDDTPFTPEVMTTLDRILTYVATPANFDANVPFKSTWALTTILTGAMTSKDFTVPNARFDNAAKVEIAIDGLPTGDIETRCRVTANGTVTAFITNHLVGTATIDATVNVYIYVTLPSVIP